MTFTLPENERHIEVHIEVTQKSPRRNIVKDLTFQATLMSSSDSWYYRIPITLTNNSDTDLSEYQIQLTLGTDFNFEHANSDGSDIRFFDNQHNPLAYWIQAWNIQGDDD